MASVSETKLLCARFCAADTTTLCQPCSLMGHNQTRWTPPPFSYTTIICLMHSYCSLTSIFDHFNGGVCQCIIPHMPFVRAYCIIATVLLSTAHSPLHLLNLTALPPYSAVLSGLLY
jgi:hypothetical protein